MSAFQLAANQLEDYRNDWHSLPSPTTAKSFSNYYAHVAKIFNNLPEAFQQYLVSIEHDYRDAVAVTA